jgi:hypothetical protein
VNKIRCADRNASKKFRVQMSTADKRLTHFLFANQPFKNTVSNMLADGAEDDVDGDDGDGGCAFDC